jgi:hypothetical protein
MENENNIVVEEIIVSTTVPFRIPDIKIINGVEYFMSGWRVGMYRGMFYSDNVIAKITWKLLKDKPCVE